MRCISWRIEKADEGSDNESDCHREGLCIRTHTDQRAHMAGRADQSPITETPAEARIKSDHLLIRALDIPSSERDKSTGLATSAQPLERRGTL